MSDVMMVNLGSDDWPEKKRVMTAAHPVPLSNVITPGVFTSIYLKLITSYYAHILLIAMLYFDRNIQDLKQTKQKYVYIIVTQRELMRLFEGDIKTDILNSTYCSISKEHFDTKTVFISYSYQKLQII